MHSQQELLEQRLVGIAMFVAGLAFGYFGAYQLLNQVAHHASSVTVSMKAAAITPVLLLAGLIFALFPRFVLTHLGGYQSPTPKTAFGWVFLVVITLSGFAFYFWLETQMRVYGYRM